MATLRKILVANRGEIALRVIRGCQELGLETVAIYSEADRMSPHVHMADEAYCIGAPAALKSYLDGEKIVDVALKCGADGIHPGYGFLSENAHFTHLVTDAGLTWIGPPAYAMKLMGDKLTARATMASANVPLVPGAGRSGQLSDEDLQHASNRIAFPLLVKAAAGGGGKGMRKVYHPEDLAEAVRVARREADSAFGDSRVYLEKLIEDGRHIEIQVLGDQHGNVIHLGERECSLQRRHQKVIEESPSPIVDEEMRRQMGEVAVKAAQAVNYQSAGTVEFIVDKDRNFYFLEMNTRLQVEHPVTEFVTGIDIVKEMLRVASGRRLRYRQEDIRLNGWAMECRILAEDPANGFMPSIGKITGLNIPTGPGVRVDSGVILGSEITPYYDSMISKLICWGENRAEAIVRMRRALEEYQIVGVTTTIPLHIQLMNSVRFQGGQIHTNFLEKNFVFNQKPNDELQRIAGVAATFVAHNRSKKAIVLDQVGPSPWRVYGRREALDRRMR